ncbi:MAG: hypothetical protein PVI40_07040 [Chlamydiota bacterium]|jgi:hypothetical protein
MAAINVPGGYKIRASEVFYDGKWWDVNNESEILPPGLVRWLNKERAECEEEESLPWRIVEVAASGITTVIETFELTSSIGKIGGLGSSATQTVGGFFKHIVSSRVSKEKEKAYWGTGWLVNLMAGKAEKQASSYIDSGVSAVTEFFNWNK